MLYEFLCYKVPFGNDEEDPYNVYEKVLQRKLGYPDFVDIRMPAKPLIEQLLSKNPVLRNNGSVENLKNHSWFVGLNWDVLLSKLITSPYKPELIDLTDEINKAIKNNTNFENRIAKEESLNDPTDNPSRKLKNSSLNWDFEF